jgi:hypothetical protein
VNDPSGNQRIQLHTHCLGLRMCGSLADRAWPRPYCPSRYGRARAVKYIDTRPTDFSSRVVGHFEGSATLTR